MLIEILSVSMSEQPLNDMIPVMLYKYSELLTSYDDCRLFQCTVKKQEMAMQQAVSQQSQKGVQKEGVYFSRLF